MRKLEFIGKVRSNEGRFSQEMVIPGRDDLLLAPEDWPMQLAPGTLTIQINDDGFPDGFEEGGTGDGLKKLDEGMFRPALVIPQRKIIDSTLKPDSDHPTRGFAQAWRGELHVLGTGDEAKGWMIRIIGSDSPTQIDLVDQEQLRAKINLTDGTTVKVTIWEAESKWTLPTPDEIIADWCQAARGVEEQFGTEKAMGYLIGEKFLNFLEGAETDRRWREAIPAFVGEIKSIFEAWQRVQFLITPRRLGPLGHASTEEGHRMLRESLDESEKALLDARNLMLLEWARELLLEEAEG